MEGQRKLMGTLWNTYAFYVLYANIDAFDRYEICAGTRQSRLRHGPLVACPKCNSYGMMPWMSISVSLRHSRGGAQALEEFVDDLS